MGSKSKHQKTIGNVEVDRISNLPIGVLTHIISSLPTKVAVATSILSKRWKYLWTNITNLDFEFPLPTRGDNSPEIISFINFVDRVLHLCTAERIHKFRLCYCEDFESPRVNEWLNEAIKRNVRELDLIVVELPRCVFNCETLTVLKLRDFFGHDFDIPNSFWLPNLKILHVDLFGPSHDLMQKLFSSCPILEDLVVLAELAYGGASIFLVSCPTLKRLKIALIGKCNGPEYKIVFNAPNVGYLNVSNNFLANYVVENLSSVDEAKVDVGYDYGSSLNGNRAVELLKGLGSVKSLSLCNRTMIALDSACSDALPTFYDLNHLELFTTNCCGRKVIPDLLEKSPNLETLILKKEQCCCHSAMSTEKDFGWNKLQSIPICLLSHLRVIKLIKFEGKKYVLELVKYVLGSAEVLETLIIDSPGLDAREESMFCKKLLEFPRVSKTCQIQFIGSNF